MGDQQLVEALKPFALAFEMKTQEQQDDLCAAVAATWEARPKELVEVASQVKAIYNKLIEWGWGDVDRDELDHATIQYSRACSVHECCQWLPFGVMPNWEDDLYCLLMDEDRWLEHINANRNVSKLARTLEQIIRERVK